MTDLDPNPYASPAGDLETTPTATRWRVIPATLSIFLGALSFAVGLFAVAVAGYLQMTEPDWEWFVEMLAACAFYLGFGGTWLLAGWLHWHRRYGRACLANLAGILIVVVIIWILEFM